MGIAKVLFGSAIFLTVAAGAAAGGAYWYATTQDIGPLVKKFVKYQYDMDIQTDGPLTIRLSPNPRIMAENLTIPAFSGDKPLFSAKKVDVQLTWGTPFYDVKTLKIDSVSLVNPTAYLSMAADGSANWLPKGERAEPADPTEPAEVKMAESLAIPTFGTVDIENLNLVYANAQAKQNIAVKSLNLKVDGSKADELATNLSGTINGQQLAGNFRANIKNFKDVPVTADFSAAGLKVAGQGRVLDQKGFVGQFNLQSGNIRQSLQTLTGKANPNIPSQPLSLTGQVKTGDTIELKSFSAKMGNVLNASGNLAFTQGAPATVNADLAISAINLNALGYCKTNEGAASTQNTAAGGQSGNQTVVPWSDEPIDLSALNLFNVNLKATINGITCTSAPVTSAQVNIINKSSKLTINQLAVGLPRGSRGEVTGDINYASGVNGDIAFKINNLPLEEFVKNKPWAKDMALPLNVEGTLDLAGKTSRELAKNLSGNIDITAKDGRLPGRDTLRTVVTLENALSGNLQALAGNPEELESMNASYAISNGIATLKNFNARAGSGALSLTGEGTINLPEWTIDHKLVAAFSTKNELNVPITIQGALTNPKAGVEEATMQRLQSRLTNQAAKQVDKLLGGSGVVGEKTKAATEAVTNILSGKGLTQEGVGSLLGAFTKPKAQPVVTSTEQPAAPAPAEAAPVTPTPTETPAAAEPAPAETTPQGQ